MLGFMRRHREWLKYFLAFVILGFILFYIPQFMRDSSSAPTTVAVVGGVPITTSEYQKEYLRERRDWEQRLQGRHMDPALLRNLGIEEQALQKLVDERILLLEAQRLGLSVSNEALAHEIAKIPDFLDNGKFVGFAEYRLRLERAGETPDEFEARFRNGLLERRVSSLITDAVDVPAAEAEREWRRRHEQIKAEYVLVNASRFRPGMTAEDDEVRARFESRKDTYKIPEKRILAYLLVDTEALKARVSVTEPEIESHYREHPDDFREDEQVCTNHILIKVKSSPTDKEGHSDEEAKRLARRVQEQLQAGGDFQALAKKSSEDSGSAARGGELECFSRGAMLPEFEQAAFSLRKGETSDLVKSSYGYHIIRLNSRREAGVPPLSQVKEPIRQALLSQRVRTIASETAEVIAAALARGKSLEDVARQQGLAVQKTKALARDEAPDPALSAALVARAFELKKGETEKELFPVSRGAAFVSVSEILPSHSPELKEVKDKVKADLLEEKAFEKARALAAEVKLKAETVGLEKAASALGLVRKETPSLVSRGTSLGDLGSSVTLDDTAYAIPEKTLSDPVRIPAGFAILRILEKKFFDPLAFEKERENLTADLRREHGYEFFQSYLAQLRQKFPVERRPDALKRVVGDGR